MQDLAYIPASRAADLLGLTEAELSERAPAAGIVPVAFLGAILYRVADIQEALDSAWRQSTDAATRGSSSGAKAGADRRTTGRVPVAAVKGRALLLYFQRIAYRV